MVNFLQLIPMRLLFVLIFGVLPVIITVYESGFENILDKEWLSFALLISGSILVYVVSVTSSSVQMQRYLWPLLTIMALGLLVQRSVMIARGEFDETTIERGGTSYE